MAKKKQRTFLSTIREMIGRIDQDSILKKIFKYKAFVGVDSVDYSQSNYYLTKAVYYASTVKNPTQLNTVEGKDFLFGAVFGKPIINSLAAFSFAQAPSIKVAGLDSEDENLQTLNDWVGRNWKTLFDIFRWALRDGDYYVRIRDDATLRLLPPERTEKVIDPVTGDLIGFDYTVYVKNENGQSDRYVTQFRKKAPYQKTLLYKDNGDNPTVVPESEVSKGVDGLLDVIAIQNEKEESMAYGISEFQNLYYLMKNYHAVLENAIKNNIFNSNAIPYIKGVENAQSWLEMNGVKNDDTGEYELKWDGGKVLIGGAGFDVNMLQGVQNSADVEIILNLLFWLICQTSETPEFVMGTAVSSSKASVSEQMPVMLRKSERKRTEFEDYIKDIIAVVIAKLNIGIVNADRTTIDIVWPPILNEDLKLNIDIVKILSDEGVITDHTKMVLLGMEDKVEDIDQEIADAHAESKEKQKAMLSSSGLSRFNQPANELNNNANNNANANANANNQDNLNNENV